MTRVTVPPDAGEPGGGWFDLRPVSSLGPDHQDDYSDLTVELYDRKRAALPPLVSDNPAVEAGPDERVVRLSSKDTVPLYALALGWVLEASSYGLDTGRLALAAKEACESPSPDRAVTLGRVLREERGKCGLPAWNVLRNAVQPHLEALNGAGPKETTGPDETTGGTSATT